MLALVIYKRNWIVHAKLKTLQERCWSVPVTIIHTSVLRNTCASEGGKAECRTGDMRCQSIAGKNRFVVTK